MTVLVQLFGFRIFGNDTLFDREALIQCYLSTPAATVLEYTTFLSEEEQKSSPRLVPASELRISPPYKRDKLLQSPFGEIPLLIEAAGLPLPAMQDSGKFIDSNGVDLTRVSNWFKVCEEKHGPTCQTASKFPTLEKA